MRRSELASLFSPFFCFVFLKALLGKGSFWRADANGL